MISPLEQFLTVAADLYATNPDYRAELEGERDTPTPPPPRRVTNRDRLDELEWLIRNGMTVTLAVEQLGVTPEALERAAHKHGRHDLAALIYDTTETNMLPGLSGRWARRWSAGEFGRNHAA